ncbi:MAG: hypothetical protein ACSHX3_16170 [Litorimonas sp.]|jgi:hypothetical protein
MAASSKPQEKQKLQNPAVLAPLLATVLIALIPLPAMSGAVLTQEQISREIVGKEITAKRKGVNVRLRYLPDGTVTMKALLMSQSGTWEFEGDGICMTMAAGPRKGRNCITFTHLSGNKFLNSEGITLTVVE